MPVYLFLLVLLGALMHAARTFAPQPGIGSGAAGTALAFGYLLLSAFFAGAVFRRLRLPRITGYIVTGIVVGPQVFNLVSDAMLVNLRIFNGVAIALIALTAGVELDLRAMRPLLRSILWLMLSAIVATAILLSVAVYLLRGLLPFLHGLAPLQLLAIAVVLGVTMAAQSPAVAVALRAEMAADGPLSQTVLGVVVLSDLLIIVLFAIVSSLARAAFGGEAGALATSLSLSWEIGGSIAAGLLAGFLLFLYLRFVRGGDALFLLAFTFIIAEVGQRVDLDPLIVALAAGMLVRNATRYGDRLYQGIEASSLPVYVVFFAVAGATIHPGAFAVVGVPAVILVTVRALGFLAGGWLGASLTRAPAAVRKYVGFGLMPQAGLALALALLFTRTFPAFGAEAAALVLGAIGMNEIVAPVLYRMALVRAGETNRWAALPAEVATHGPATELKRRVP